MMEMLFISLYRSFPIFSNKIVEGFLVQFTMMEKQFLVLLLVNYRPISLLSNLNKIFEKLVHERLYSFLELHDCIFELQFGFRTKHSTNHALMSLTEMVRNALDNSKFACGIFVDFQKAFDTVDHNVLIRKTRTLWDQRSG